MIEDHPKRGRDVTMDALHTQRTSATLLHEAGAHYVMAPKGNQATLLGDVATFLGDHSHPSWSTRTPMPGTAGSRCGARASPPTSPGWPPINGLA